MTIEEMLKEFTQKAHTGMNIICRVDGFDEPGMEIEPNEVIEYGDTIYLDFCRKLPNDSESN